MPDKITDADGFSKVFDVSRETTDLLEQYVKLIKKWNSSINLVSKSTIPDVWHRHIADSAQLINHVPSNTPLKWVDIGSGGGLPGIVISVLAKDRDPRVDLSLVESDTRKCVFLRTVVRELGLDVDVIEERIELLPSLNADVISARAFTGLSRLLEISANHANSNTVCLFLKGQTHNAELTEAHENWNINVESFPSITDSTARLLKIKGI